MYGVGLLAFVLFLSTLIGAPVLPALSRQLGAGTTEIPIVVSASLATVVIAQLFTGFLADRYSKRALILTGALIGAVSSLLCVAATNWIQLAILRVVGGVADAVAMPALLVITASLAKDKPGKFFGILRGSQGLSFAVGPALGSIFSLLGLRAPFVADGVLSVIAFFAAFAFIRDTQKVKPEHDLKLFHGFKSVFARKQMYVFPAHGDIGTL